MYIFCSICQDLLTFEKGPVLALICGHVYHKNCIEKWMRRNRSCPICKEFIGAEKLQRLYFSFRQDDPGISKLQNKINKLNDYIQQNVKDLELMDLEANKRNLEIEKKDRKIKVLKQKIHELTEQIDELEIHLTMEDKVAYSHDKENSVINQKPTASSHREREKEKEKSSTKSSSNSRHDRLSHEPAITTSTPTANNSTTKPLERPDEIPIKKHSHHHHHSHHEKHRERAREE